MKTNPAIELLAAQPFLKGLSVQQLELLAENAMPAEFKTDELIFKEGGPANRFYILLSGEVALESPCPKCDDERGTATIETVGAGSVLGWSWLFPPYYSHFNARALSPVKAIFFYGTRLREQCENDHDLGYELMKRIAQIFIERLQATRGQLAAQSKNLSLAA
ncbi:MAG TPA: Crp/Fnr family transcriptional regulator [Verrucomicrobiae bacterium]|nr:Crp/Fnr family transcriptional regulator [Verrucomicrobiae bacterium]